MSRNLLKTELGELPVVASMIVIQDFRPAYLARGVDWEKTSTGWEFTSVKQMGFRPYSQNRIDEALYYLERV